MLYCLHIILVLLYAILKGFLKMKKRLLSLLISATMLFSTTTSAFLSNASTEKIYTEEEKLELVEKFVEFDGEKLAFTDCQSVVSILGNENYKSILNAFSEINNLVESGDLAITENLTIYETADEELVVQGGNVNKTKLCWNGLKSYFSKTNAEKAAREFQRMGDGLSAVSTGCGIVLGLAGATPFGIGSAAIALISFIYGTQSKWIAEDIRYVNSTNGNNGVILMQYWIAGYSVYSQ